MKRLLVLMMVLLSLGACGTNGSASSKHVMTGRGMSKTEPDREATRHIIVAYPYTHETVDVIYFHDGAYDKAALAKIDQLFRDRHVNVVGHIDPELIDYMVDIRTRLSLPPTAVFQVLSGYRTRQTNASLATKNGNVAKESLHLHGWAVDFRIDGVNGKAISAIAKTMQRGGVAYYPEDNHVHVDLGNIRTWHEAGN